MSYLLMPKTRFRSVDFDWIEVPNAARNHTRSQPASTPALAVTPPSAFERFAMERWANRLREIISGAPASTACPR